MLDGVVHGADPASDVVDHSRRGPFAPQGVADRGDALEDALEAAGPQRHDLPRDDAAGPAHVGRGDGAHLAMLLRDRAGPA